MISTNNIASDKFQITNTATKQQSFINNLNISFEGPVINSKSAQKYPQKIPPYYFRMETEGVEKKQIESLEFQSEQNRQTLIPQIDNGVLNFIDAPANSSQFPQINSKNNQNIIKVKSTPSKIKRDNKVDNQVRDFQPNPPQIDRVKQYVNKQFPNDQQPQVPDSQNFFSQRNKVMFRIDPSSEQKQRDANQLRLDLRVQNNQDGHNPRGSVQFESLSSVVEPTIFHNQLLNSVNEFRGEQMSRAKINEKGIGRQFTDSSQMFLKNQVNMDSNQEQQNHLNTDLIRSRQFQRDKLVVQNLEEQFVNMGSPMKNQGNEAKTLVSSTKMMRNEVVEEQKASRQNNQSQVGGRSYKQSGKETVKMDRKQMYTPIKDEVKVQEYDFTELKRAPLYDFHPNLSHKSTKPKLSKSQNVTQSQQVARNDLGLVQSKQSEMGIEQRGESKEMELITKQRQLQVQLERQQQLLHQLQFQLQQQQYQQNKLTHQIGINLVQQSEGNNDPFNKRKRQGEKQGILQIPISKVNLNQRQIGGQGGVWTQSSRPGENGVGK